MTTQPTDNPTAEGGWVADFVWRSDRFGVVVDIDLVNLKPSEAEHLLAMRNRPWHRVLKPLGQSERRSLYSALRARAAFRKVRLLGMGTSDDQPVLLVSGAPLTDDQGAFSGYRGAGLDITELSRLEVLRGVVEMATGGESGFGYLDIAARKTVEATGADFMMIGMFSRNDDKIVEVISAHARHLTIEAGTLYAYQGTPCEGPLRGETVVIRDGAMDRYPHHSLLSRLRPQGYVGIPLRDSRGQVIGLAALGARRPFQFIEDVAGLMTTLAGRFGAELERALEKRRGEELDRVFRTVLDKMPVGYHQRDAEGRFVFVNRQFEEWARQPDGGLLGKTIDALSPNWPDKATLDEHLRTDEIVLSQAKTVTYQVTRLRPTGKREVVLTKFPILTSDGQPDGIGAIATDITDITHQQRLFAMGRLAGGIAHDFNNIVGAIRGYAQFLSEDLPQDSVLRDYAKRILSASDRAGDLVQQIVSFAQARRLKLAPVSFTRALEAAIEIVEMSEDPDLARAPVRCDCSDGTITVIGNEAQLVQIGMNLVHNAVQACHGENGSVWVSLRHGQPPEGLLGVRTSAAIGRYTTAEFVPERAYATLTVRDNGVGIDPSRLPSIFEPFHTNRGSGAGTGFGLAIVAATAQAMDGIVTVESHPGTGTAIHFSLPVHDGAAKAPCATSSKLVKQEERGVVMVVDDDPDIGSALDIALQRSGYPVVMLTDPLEALTLFKQAPEMYAVVVSDQIMPNLRGLDLLAELRAIRPGVPFILCTGYDETVDENAALDAGVTAFFQKPFDLKVLVRTVGDLMDPVTPSADRWH